MKHVIVTLLVNKSENVNVSDYELYGLPWLKRYAERLGCDLAIIRNGHIEINGEVRFTYDTEPYEKINGFYYKYELCKLFELYERVCLIDTDVIIRDTCPDLFEVVPSHKFGVYCQEHPGYKGPIVQRNTLWAQHTRNKIEQYYGLKDVLYFNSGVMVCSKQHQAIFDLSLGTMPYWGDQVQLNYNVAKLGVEICPLSAVLNYPVNDQLKVRKVQHLERRPPNVQELIDRTDIQILHFCDPKIKKLFVPISKRMAE